MSGNKSRAEVEKEEVSFKREVAWIADACDGDVEEAAAAAAAAGDGPIEGGI